jgi:hypothetical protein
LVYPSDLDDYPDGKDGGYQNELGMRTAWANRPPISPKGGYESVSAFYIDLERGFIVFFSSLSGWKFNLVLDSGLRFCFGFSVLCLTRATLSLSHSSHLHNAHTPSIFSTSPFVSRHQHRFLPSTSQQSYQLNSSKSIHRVILWRSLLHPCVKTKCHDARCVSVFSFFPLRLPDYHLPSSVLFSFCSLLSFLNDYAVSTIVCLASVLPYPVLFHSTYRIPVIS